MTTMRDVARVAGVSAKTVSRVFNDDPHVTPETRERVQWAMQRLNYVPNLLARSFRAGADAAIGLAFPDIADPFFAAMTSGIEESLVERKMALVVTSLGYEPEREAGALETLLRRQISGLIVAAVSRDQSYLGPWAQRTPMVFVDRAPSGLAAPSVVEDDFGGAKQAVEHLARHGHRRIALIGVTTHVSTSRRRVKGYRAAVADGELDNAAELVCMSQSAQSAAEDFVALLASTPPPTAAFCVDIRCTMALILALKRAGRTDVALVGFGDFPMAEALTPAITVVDQNPARLGRVAVDRMSRLLAADTDDRHRPGGRARLRTVLPVSLIPRGSGELPPTGSR